MTTSVLCHEIGYVSGQKHVRPSHQNHALPLIFIRATGLGQTSFSQAFSKFFKTQMGISHDLHMQYTVYREMKIRYKIPLGIVGRWSNLGRQHTSGPSPPPSEASGSRSSLMCLRERKRRCAASWLICLMLLSDSEDTSLKGGRGHVRREGVFRASPPPAQPSLWAMHRLRPQCQATNTGSLPLSSSETIARLTLTPQK